jgi:hypothetical protein
MIISLADELIAKAKELGLNVPILDRFLVKSARPSRPLHPRDRADIERNTFGSSDL